MSLTPSENAQSAYHLTRNLESSDLDRDIHDAMYSYLTADLGIAAEPAAQRARKELERTIPKHILGNLVRRGAFEPGMEVLELGAGLGGMSEELVLNQASLTALEPGAAWARITQRRLERHAGRYKVLNAFGESIPLEDESVDLIVSLQVLEHVRNPAAVLSEAYRVLRPGGHFFLACENYLSFYEPHYRVPWLPLMPKRLGALYLRAIGRSPRFLEEAITYVTYPQVVGWCRSLGFIRDRDTEIARNIESKDSMAWRSMRALSAITGGRGPRFADDLRNMFNVGIVELLRKPGAS